MTKGNGTVKTPLQLSLFEEANSRTMQVAGFVSAIKAAMFRAARDSAMSREQITDRMNDVALAAGVRMTQGRARIISQDTLDKWLSADDREHVPSMLAVHVFCAALGTIAPLRVWLSSFGCDVMTPADRKLRNYGQACIEGKVRAKSKRRLEDELLEQEALR